LRFPSAVRGGRRFAREREDVVGRHPHGRTLAHPADEIRAAPACTRGLLEDGDPPLDAELHFGVGEEAETFADLERDCHLALGCNLHGGLRYKYYLI
jgi:hypothetical protein